MGAVYILEHGGHYLGGVIIVVESDVDAAGERMTRELISAGIKESDFDISQIRPIDIDNHGTVYFTSGDY